MLSSNGPKGPRKKLVIIPDQMMLIANFSQLLEALELYLPGSPVFDVLSQLPPPDPTAPTGNTTHQAQLVMENTLPILEEMTALEENIYATFIKKEIDQRRTRLGAPPLKLLKLEAESEACSQTKVS